jgi:hypothetical protein
MPRQMHRDDDGLLAGVEAALFRDLEPRRAVPYELGVQVGRHHDDRVVDPLRHHQEELANNRVVQAFCRQQGLELAFPHTRTVALEHHHIVACGRGELGHGLVVLA